MGVSPRYKFHPFPGETLSLSEAKERGQGDGRRRFIITVLVLCPVNTNLFAFIKPDCVPKLLTPCMPTLSRILVQSSVTRRFPSLFSAQLKFSTRDFLS